MVRTGRNSSSLAPDGSPAISYHCFTLQSRLFLIGVYRDGHPCLQMTAEICIGLACYSGYSRIKPGKGGAIDQAMLKDMRERLMPSCPAGSHLIPSCQGSAHCNPCEQDGPTTKQSVVVQPLCPKGFHLEWTPCVAGARIEECVACVSAK